MDQDQIIKKIEWLDEQRRNDRALISELENKVASLENTIEQNDETIKELGSELSRLNVVLSKVNDFEDALEKHRQDVKGELENQENRKIRREEELRNLQKVEIENLVKFLNEHSTKLEEIPRLQQKMATRVDEETRINKIIAEIQAKVDDIRKLDEERERNYRTMSNARAQDEKRLMDLQGEIHNVRKRLDETRGRIDLNTDAHKRFETRLNDLMSGENERKDNVQSLTEKINYQEMERSKAWNEWKKRFDLIESQSVELGVKLQEIDSADRAVKRAQESYSSMTGQMDRRINEVTEMQRLGEERFRQEWNTFRADDQKRWTNFTLTQEELMRELNRHLDRQGDQLTSLRDNLHEIDDIVKHITSQNDQQLKSLMTMIRDWASENEQFLSGIK